MKNKIAETDFEFRIYTEKGKGVKIQKTKGSGDFRKLTDLSKPQVDSSQYNNFLTVLEKNMKK